MIARKLMHVIVAGVVAGLSLSLAQAFFTLPILAIAEQIENNLPEASDVFAAARFAKTIIANLATSLCFALLVLAILYLCHLTINKKNCLLWIFAFWGAVFFIPALSLPPHLPGMGGGHDHLVALQIAWVVLVLSAGLSFLLHSSFFKNIIRQFYRRCLLSLLLLLGSYLWVNEVLHDDLLHQAGAIPAGLAQIFAVRSLASNLIFSAVLIMVFAIADRKW